MKPIYIESDEEISSVIKRIKSRREDAIAIVVPRGATILQSLVNLKLLKREADRLNKELSLVTQDRVGRNLASQTGLTVYSRIEAGKPSGEIVRHRLDGQENPDEEAPDGINVHRYYDQEATKRPAPDEAPASSQDQSKVEEVELEGPAEEIESRSEIEERPRIELSNSPFSRRKLEQTPESDRKMNDRVEAEVGVASDSGKSELVEPERKPPSPFRRTVLVLILILFVGGAFLPEARVKLEFSANPVEIDARVRISEAAKRIDDGAAIIPGKLFRAVNEEKDQFEARGKKNLGQKATGTIIVQNRAGAVQEIPLFSQFRNNKDLVFKTTKAVSVAAASAKVDSLGNAVITPGAASVEVEALEPGEDKNLPPQSFKVLIGGELSRVLTGESESSFSGGTTRNVKVVTEIDISESKEQILERLREKNLLELKNQLKEGQLLLASGVVNNLLSETVSKKAGDEAEFFEVELKLESKTLVANEKDFRQVAVSSIGTRLSDEKTLVLSSNDEIAADNVVFDESALELRIEGKMKTKVGKKVAAEEVRSLIRAKTPVETRRILEARYSPLRQVVELSPSFWPRLPLFGNRIRVEVNYE